MYYLLPSLGPNTPMYMYITNLQRSNASEKGIATKYNADTHQNT